MSVASSEIITRTIDVLEDVCLLLDDEIDQRTQDPIELSDEALKFAQALESIRILVPKLQVVRAALAKPDLLQPDLWLTDGD